MIKLNGLRLTRAVLFCSNIHFGPVRGRHSFRILSHLRVWGLKKRVISEFWHVIEILSQFEVEPSQNRMHMASRDNISFKVLLSHLKDPNVYIFSQKMGSSRGGQKMNEKGRATARYKNTYWLNLTENGRALSQRPFTFYETSWLDITDYSSFMGESDFTKFIWRRQERRFKQLVENDFIIIRNKSTEKIKFLELYVY